MSAYVFLAILLLAAQFAHDRMVGLDGFFHVQQARAPWGGMPWMPLSLFADGWVDHQLLFHVLLAPLTWVFDGIVAAKVGAALLGAFGLWGIYVFLRVEGAPLPLLFALLPAAMSWQFLVRLEMPRVQGLSLGLLLLVSLALVRDRPRAAFALSFAYAWAYHVSALVLPVAALHVVIGLLPLAVERPRLAWRAPAAAVAGLVSGFVIHPHSPRTLRFFWQHVVLKVQNRAALPVGGEWEQGGVTALLAVAGGGVAALIVAAGLAAWRRGQRAELPVSRLTIFALVLAAGATVGALRSTKFLEYSVPLSCLALGLAVRDRRLFRGRVSMKTALPLAALVLIGFLGSSWRAADAIQREEPAPDRLETAMRWLHAEDPSGPMVYHFSWNDFPELVFWGPENRYVVGLDPHFLYLQDPALWDLYAKIEQGWGTNPSKPIHQRFGARWAVLVLPWPGAVEILDADPGLSLAYSDDHARIYRVNAPPGI